MIDSHCHLDFKEFKGRIDEVVYNALAAGVHTMVNIGVDLESSRESVALAHRYDCIYATVGVHPHDARKYDEVAERELFDLAGERKVVAVGEIGLDFYRDLSPRQVQKRVFRRQLELAVEKGLPVVIHTRDSFGETAGIVQEYSKALKGGVFHCFPGTIADARRVMAMGFYVSVGGIITFPKARMAALAGAVPLERLLLETDSPYLAPVPYRGKTNEPAFVRHVRDKVAELRGISVAEVEKITDRNCRKLYRMVEVFEG